VYDFGKLGFLMGRTFGSVGFVILGFYAFSYLET
jgi:hypothetical protein